MARYTLPVIGNASTATIALDTANSAGTGVVRDPSDSSINVGPVNCTQINNTGPDLSPIKAVSATYPVGANDRTLIADATSSAFTITLPSVSASTGRKITVKRVNSGSNAVTLGVSDGATIDGASTNVLGSQYAKVTVESDGTSWQVI
jgi:hypothetical protein